VTETVAVPDVAFGIAVSQLSGMVYDAEDCPVLVVVLCTREEPKRQSTTWYTLLRYGLMKVTVEALPASTLEVTVAEDFA